MKQFIAIIFFLTGSLLNLQAQTIPEPPDPPKLVNDYSNILNANEENNLESYLVAFARETSTQIVVVIIDELETSISDFAFKLGEKWGVGQGEKNNGAVIILKPKKGNERGQVFVATGYGLEHLIPDAIANRDIVDGEMIPHFKKDDYYGGLAAGIQVIMDLASEEYTASEYQERAKKSSGGGSAFFLLFLLFFVIIPLLSGRRRRAYSPGRSLPFWIAMGMMGSNRSSHSGSFGNFSLGGGSFGSGGFGGFGGGSFGGGGAGGSW